MTIEEAKKLKVGDRVTWACIHNDTGVVAAVSWNEIQIKWDGTGVHHLLLSDPHELFSGITLIESEGLQRARKYKVGDRVQYVTKYSGTWTGRVSEVTNQHVEFCWDQCGTAGTWRFEFPNLVWDHVTLAPEPTPLEKVTQERDNLQAALEASEKTKNELAQKLETCMNEYISYEKKCRANIARTYGERNAAQDALKVKDDLLKIVYENCADEVAQMKMRLAHTDSAYRERDEAREALQNCRKVSEALEVRAHENTLAAIEWRQRGTYYRDLVLQCAEVLGPEKFVCDDGTVVPDVLVAKVPELIRKLASTAADDKSKLEAVMCALDQARQRTCPVSINGVYLFATGPEVQTPTIKNSGVVPTSDRP